MKLFEVILEFIEKYWAYLVTTGTVLAYLFEKGRIIWLEKKAKKTSYNRLFTSVLKLHFSYLKHSELYAEKPPMNFPDEMYIPMLKHLDTFDSDLNEFKETVGKESDVIPEIIIQTHMLFDAIDRIRIVDRIQAKNIENHIQISDTENVGIKRAQFYAMKEMYDDFFEDLITDLQKKTKTSPNFIKRIKYFKTEKYKLEVADEQKKIMKRYYESLNRQDLIPNELYNILVKQFQLI